MKRSVSSVLAERIRLRAAVTPVKHHNVRKVKFTPEEMAYDIPDDTSHFIPVTHEPGNFFAKPTKEQIAAHRRKRALRNNARLEPSVRKAFPDDKTINDLLRQLLKLSRGLSSEKRRKSA